ncbi:SpoIVB peptidase S55 domain-containing protein [Romboutsia sp. 13368]|uniref:SpoIVB peptidase S55 domain-containing protein n=1 Tax=Romboutsia sp. 13368 TaxID=2708053 RepID=UPI0025EC6F07|nr:SpoIVB peptidase S55 domain-containing protein [Romboutsia sp. 13368]
MFYKNGNKKIINTKFSLLVCLLFLIYFFSNNLIYAKSITKTENESLIPIGNVIHIETQLENITVRGTTNSSPFNLGDEIISINNINIKNYSDLSNILNSLPNNTNIINVTVKRNNHLINIKTIKEKLDEVNLTDNISGFATLTYINPISGEFGAIAHPISLGSYRKINIKNGFISTTSNLNIKKSYRGNVGCINAKPKDYIGKFNNNTNFGIKGNIVKLDTSNFKIYEVASLDEVMTGKAQILLQTSNDGCKKFDIEILSIENQKAPKPKTFKIRIVDKELLQLTGGIVQGMSGTPIIQNDKIIGAISHAVENDPTTGYAVFIKWMMEN